MVSEELADWIVSGLAPALKCEEERPAEREDYSQHRALSLNILRNIQSCDKITTDLTPSVILLCSQHCSAENLPWSSAEHREICQHLVSVIEAHFLPVGTLLGQTEGKLFKSLAGHLQPSLSEFTRQPGSVQSLLWLASQVTEPGELDVLVPLLLPHLLHWLDSWLPHYKLAGCLLAQHIAAHSSPSQLIFYGRAEVLTEPLTRLVASSEVSLARAAGQPLLSLTSIRHDSQRPASPGQADQLMKTLVGSLEVCSDTERQEVLCQLLTPCLGLLGPGAARWVSALAQLAISLLGSSISPPSVLATLRHLASVCPQCLARETQPLLTALFKHLHSLTSAGRSSGLAPLSDCIVEVARCDIDTARLLCQGLQQTSVNKTFDSICVSILTTLNI